MKNPVSLKDIATACKVSVSTVCRALQNHPRISPATRDKVWKSARAKGYRPDPMLRALVARRWPDSKRRTWCNLAFVCNPSEESRSRMVRYSEKAAEFADERGYNLEFIDLGRANYSRRLHDVLQSRGVRGILLGPLENDALAIDLPWDEYAVINCGLGDLPPMGFHVVAMDYFYGAMEAWNRVRAAGYSRIGIALTEHSPHIMDDRFRLGALLESQFRHGDTAVPPYVGELKNKQAFLKWFKQHRPEVIISFLPLTMRWLEEEGYSTPGDVAFVCLAGLSHRTNLEDPRVAGFSNPYCETLRIALDRLDDLLRHGEFGIPSHAQHIYVAPKWVGGASLPPAGVNGKKVASMATTCKA